MVFSQDQRVFILEHYFPTRSYAECQNVFRNSFLVSVVPNKSTIQRLVERFRETESIGEKRRSCRLSVLSNYSLEDIRASLLQSPRKALRKLSQQTGMIYGSVQMATKRLKLPMGCVTFGSFCSVWNMFENMLLRIIFALRRVKYHRMDSYVVSRGAGSSTTFLRDFLYRTGWVFTMNSIPKVVPILSQKAPLHTGTFCACSIDFHIYCVDW
jgi:hypothetical protein